ncbi:MAG: LAGLIDADG family homing endonuclease [Nitrososphaerota archaeon]
MEAVGVSTISKGEEKRRYLPLEIRATMYDDVIELKKQGLSYTQIQRKIYEKCEIRLPRSTISDWVNRKRHPLGKVNKFDGKPSLELAYAIGTKNSDGCLYFNNDRKYSIILAVNDKEFAEEFGKCLAKLLHRKEPYKPFWDKKHKQWRVECCSILLYKFLNKPLEELKPYIEYSKDCVSAFLRALFDGEGSIYVSRKRSRRILMLFNTNIELLNYAKYLLKKYFDIDATGPYLARKGGEILRFPNGKVVKTKKDYYYIYIRAKSLLNFYKYIGFTIRRKQQILIEANKEPLPLFLFSFY